jgi:hypothetical protein
MEQRRVEWMGQAVEKKRGGRLPPTHPPAVAVRPPRRHAALFPSFKLASVG